MDLLWMMLLTVLVHSEAKNVTVGGELGEDVTLTCSLSHSKLHWFMEINKTRIQIGHTLRSSFASYNSPDFQTKYKMMENRLVVRNVTAEDSRRYFCGRMENRTMVYGDTIQLITNVSVTTANVSDNSNQAECAKKLLKDPVAVTSLTLNAVLVLVLGLTYMYLWKKRCCRVKNHPEADRENVEMQVPPYEEIHLPPLPPEAHSESIYYKAQHPHPVHHR